MLATSLGCLNHTEVSPPRISLRCSQLSHLIHQRWEPSRVSFDTRSWPTACQILVTGLDLILERVAKTMSFQREDMKSDLPEACCRNRLFCKALFHEKILSPSYRGRPAIHEGRQMRSQNTPAPHSFTKK